MNIEKLRDNIKFAKKFAHDYCTSEEFDGYTEKEVEDGVIILFALLGDIMEANDAGRDLTPPSEFIKVLSSVGVEDDQRSRALDVAKILENELRSSISKT